MAQPAPHTPHASDRLLAMGGAAPSHHRESVVAWGAESTVDKYLEKPIPASDAPPFYRLDNPSPAHNPLVNEMKEEARALIRVGLLEPSDLEGLSFRVLRSAVATPEVSRPAEAEHADSLSSKNGLTLMEGVTGGLLQTSTSFYPQVKTINVDGRETSGYLPTLEYSTAAKEIFRHELAHGTMPDYELKARVAVVLEQQWAKSPEDAHVVVAAMSPKCEGKTLGIAMGEIYADSFSVVSTLALHGRDAALEQTDAFLAMRQAELDVGVHYIQNDVNPSFVADHHTTEALLLVKEKLLDGSAEQMLAHGRGRDLVMDVAAKGYVAEYVNTRLADMNVHYLAEGGQLTPGLPEGIASRDVILADDQGGGSCRGAAGMTLVTPKGSLDDLQAHSLEMRGGVGGETTAPFQNRASASFDLVEFDRREMSIVDRGTGATVEAHQGTNPIQVYLETHASHRAEQEPEWGPDSPQRSNEALGEATTGADGDRQQHREGERAERPAAVETPPEPAAEMSAEM